MLHKTASRRSVAMPRLFALVLAILAALAWGPGLARDDLDRSPYGPVAHELLTRLHATELPCDIALDPSTRCFTIAPGTVAAVAELLENVLIEYGGTLTRSAWRSANGVHHVGFWLHDDVWGALELWLTEPDGRNVAGRLSYLPKRRNGAP